MILIRTLWYMHTPWYHRREFSWVPLFQRAPCWPVARPLKISLSLNPVIASLGSHLKKYLETQPRFLHIIIVSLFFFSYLKIKDVLLILLFVTLFPIIPLDNSFFSFGSPWPLTTLLSLLYTTLASCSPLYALVMLR